jgi:hypothetical protein
VVARYGWAATVAGTNPEGLPAPGDIDGWIDRAGLASLSAETAAALRGYVAANPKLPEHNQQLGVLTLLLTSPDWNAL